MKEASGKGIVSPQGSCYTHRAIRSLPEVGETHFFVGTASPEVRPGP